MDGVMDAADIMQDPELLREMRELMGEDYEEPQAAPEPAGAAPLQTDLEMPAQVDDSNIQLDESDMMDPELLREMAELSGEPYIPPAPVPAPAPAPAPPPAAVRAPAPAPPPTAAGLSSAKIAELEEDIKSVKVMALQKKKAGDMPGGLRNNHAP